MEKYKKYNKHLAFPTSKIIDVEYILESTPEPEYTIFNTIRFGSFWSAMEYPPEYRNCTAAANVILGDPDTKEIASRMVTMKHLVLRMGLEDSSWPEILSFDPFIYLGSLKGITAFTISGFVFLAATICGCFLMYFAILLLDDKKEEIPDNVIDFVDESDFHNRGFDQWILIATVLQSFLFFLLVVCNSFFRSYLVYFLEQLPPVPIIREGTYVASNSRYTYLRRISTE